MVIIDGSELHEMQESTLKSFKRLIREIKSEHSENLSKLTEKHINTIENNLDSYLIMYDTLIRVRESNEMLRKSKDLETTENELKNLYDTFWD